MSNSNAELAELAERVEAGATEGSLSSERAVQLRAVEPLLEVLGWDVRGPAVVPAATIEDLTVDYLLTIDDVPAVLVETAGPSDDLETAGVAPIERRIADGHPSRGIVTDGRTVVLVVEQDGEVHRRSFPFAALTDHAEALGQFHRSVVARTTAVERADRPAAARRLDENRTQVVESITETIVDVADEPIADEAAAAAERTVDTLVETFRSEDAGDSGGARRNLADSVGDSDLAADTAGSESSVTEHSGTGPSGKEHSGKEHSGTEPSGKEHSGTEPSATGPSATAPESTPAGTWEGSAQGGDGAVGSSRPDEGPQDTVEARPESRTSDGGEYVVRFFGGSSSVGAVGTETPRGTTVGTVRYLLENHGLASSITLPWRDDEETVVLADESGGDGWTTLSNASGDSISVRPIDDPDTARRVIDGLVEAAGLRAMFQGDW
jgi:hypothetical protein